MAGAPSPAQQRRMLELLHSRGFVAAAPDHRVLRYLEFQRQARACPLHTTRGKVLETRVWQITPAGVAALFRLKVPTRRRPAAAAHRQIDLEEALASSSGGAPDVAPLTDPDTPAASTAGVSAPEAAQSRHSARGRQPEPTHA